jgi:hypothetical protein
MSKRVIKVANAENEGFCNKLFHIRVWGLYLLPRVVCGYSRIGQLDGGVYIAKCTALNRF